MDNNSENYPLCNFNSPLSPDSPLSTFHYQFSDLLIRARLDWDGELPDGWKSLGELIGNSIYRSVDQEDIRVVIVDNITYLSGSLTGASSALKLMKGLKQFKQELGVSVLVLAHTPKRHYASALTINDLAGSKMLANFADNVFAIGKSSQARDIRYLKQIKQRTSALEYDTSNVIVYRLGKMRSPTDNGQITKHNDSENCPLSTVNCPFLGFAHLGFSTEHGHLIRPYDNANGDRARLIEQAKGLAAAGKSQREIAAELGLSLGTVNNYLNQSLSAASCQNRER